MKMGFFRGAGRVAIVIDKPEFYHPPGMLLHSMRQKKAGVEGSSTSRFPQATEKCPLAKSMLQLWLHLISKQSLSNLPQRHSPS